MTIVCVEMLPIDVYLYSTFNRPFARCKFMRVIDYQKACGVCGQLTLNNFVFCYENKLEFESFVMAVSKLSFDQIS